MKVLISIFVLSLIISCGQNFRPNKKINNDTSAIDSSIKIVNKSVSINESDILNVNGYRLIFNPSDSVYPTDIFGDGELRKRMTDTIGNSNQQSEFIEKYLHEKFKNYFSANDKTLTLYLADKSKIEFLKWDDKKEEGYNFEHYFPTIDYFLLHVQWIEGNCWMLVNRKNGFKKYIIGRPYISPSKKFILTINSDITAGFSDNGFELITISADTLKTELTADVSNWGPIGAKWISDDKFILQKEYFDTTTGDISFIKKYCTVTIKKNGL